MTLVIGPDAVQAIEQRDNARSFDRLPTNATGGYPNGKERAFESRRQAECMGFVYGEKIDDLFVAVTPPEGWRMRPTDHGMYTDIIDGQGRLRGSQFYKAAFYDRDAFFHFKTRFQIEEMKPEDWFERSHPRTLTRTEKRRVKVDGGDSHGDRPYRDHVITSDGYVLDNDMINEGLFARHERDRYGYVKPRERYEMRDVEVPLPDDEQPKARGYDMAYGIIDTATGEMIYVGDTLYNPCKEEDPRWFDDTARNQARALVAAKLENLLPECANPAAYWDDADPLASKPAKSRKKRKAA